MAPPYRPCPEDGQPCKVLPLGDSITWGIHYEGGYRIELFHRAMTARQNMTFSGSLLNGPTTVDDVPFPRSNNGHNGWTIEQIGNAIPTPAFNELPHIVLLLIGTNDIYAPDGQAEMPVRLGRLLDQLFYYAPQALFFVGEIPPLATLAWNARVMTYNEAIPAVVAAKAASGKHVLSVDLNTGFTPEMLSSDGVHPNPSGYAFLGDAWYAAISQFLPADR